jgi:acyl carrier protein
MPMNELEQELKQLIIDGLKLEDITVEEINSRDALFTTGLGLDSIDALELVILIKSKYNVTFDTNSEDMNRHFASIHNLAQFILSQQKPRKG